MNIIKRTGLIFLYALIVLLTISGAIADEIPVVQLEDTSGVSYLNIFNYNTSVHNNLTGLQGGLAPNEYYHLNYAQYLTISSILGNATFYPFLNVDWINGSNATFQIVLSDDWDNVSITESQISDFGDYAPAGYGDEWNKTYADTLYAKYQFENNNFNGTGNFTTTGWFNGKFNISTADDWNSFDGSLIDFNESKLEIVYYNLNQSNIIAGTLDGGTLIDTQHPDGIYDGVTVNFTESAGSPALDIRLNFTNIDDFSRGVIRYKTSNLAGNYPIIQMWNYDSSVWEDYPPIAETLIFATITQPVFDSSSHLENGIVQMRIYKLSNGNVNNHYYIDWIAISKGYGVPSGEEIDPYSWHLTDFNITDYFTITEILGFNYYNASDFSIADYVTLTNLLRFGYYNSSDFDITDYYTITEILGFNYYNASDFSISDYYTKTQIDNFNYYNATDFDIADYSTTAEADLLYAPINYNPFNQSLNTSDSVQFNNITINNIVFDENRTITINDTCMILKAFDTYINLCK